MEQGPYFFVWRAQNIIKSNAQSIFVFTQNTRSKRRLNLLRFFSGDINMINPNHSRKKVVQLQPRPARAHIRKRHKSGYHRKFYFISFLSLRSKRFQSSYCAKVRAEAKKKVEGGGGGETRKRLPANPTILENAP